MEYTLQGALPNAFVCITACDSQFFKGDTVFVPFYRWENKRSQRLNALLRGGRVENLGAQTSDSHMQPQTGNFQQPESGQSHQGDRVLKANISVFPFCPFPGVFCCFPLIVSVRQCHRLKFASSRRDGGCVCLGTDSFRNRRKPAGPTWQASFQEMYCSETIEYRL